ncbi:MAG: PilT/PilU family type 4a pilus ATPase [Candidatus Omnitrophica bacterium]|nr:PilT/PilU family type 4a pilus ATPase [Candidatus Omnitrophota bacterium]
MIHNNIKWIIETAVKHNASDIHLYPNQPPILRIDGQLTPMDIPAFKPEDLKQILFDMLKDNQKNTFLEQKELDFSYTGVEGHQCRVNLHLGEQMIAGTIRITPKKILTREELGLPIIIDKLCQKRQGIIILSGVAGSGKSTTLTYMIDFINRQKKCKIIIIEDPIEYYHDSKQSLILQREVGTDTNTFATALKYAFRQDPDVVVVGEMRDLESISMALTTAETGHLVLTTAHSPDATETINRIIDVYPSGYRDQILIQLSRNLTGIISQNLIPRKDEKGRMLATEVLTSTMAVQNLIRRGALVELRALMDSDSESGMYSLEKCLSELLKSGAISKKTAIEYANYQHTLKHHLKLQESQEVLQKTKETSPSEASADKPPADKILIIDNNDGDRVGLAMFLKARGYEKIVLAKTDDEGLEKIALHKPSIILLDVNPLDDYEFKTCQKIKEIPGLAARTILYTRWDIKPDNIRCAQNAGAVHLVSKSLNYDDILQSIAKSDPKH